MDRRTTHDDDAEAHLAGALRPSSPPYLDLDDDDDITPIASSRRIGSWDSDDTFVRAENSFFSSKGDDRSTVDFDLGDDDAYTSRPRRRRWLKFGIIFGATLLAILLALDILLRVSRSTWLEEKDEADAEFCRWGKKGSNTEGLSWYPTNFLQDVLPKPIHSHNDYWRKVPLFTALKQGAMSVEADVWLLDEPERRDTLYVGHERAALQPRRTFQSLYIQPIVEILEKQNPQTEFYNDNYRGVFDTDSNQTLILLVDVKTSGPATWAKVVEQLEPLRQRNWLTYYANNTVHTRPVTVVGTGNTPFADLVANETYRDYFYDAPLNKLNGSGGGGGHGKGKGKGKGKGHGDSDSNSNGTTYNATNSFYASVSFGSAIGTPWMGGLGAEQLERIRGQVRQAHAAGLKVRYWDLPSWPVSTRNRIWDLLVKEGVDMLNVDNVKAAAKRQWEY